MTGRKERLSWEARAEEVSLKVLPKRCNRGTVSYMEREGLPKGRGMLTEGIRKVFYLMYYVLCLGIMFERAALTISILSPKCRRLFINVIIGFVGALAASTNFNLSLATCCITPSVSKPARFFLNRLLHLLRQSHNTSDIAFTHHFHRDPKWVCVFIESYMGVQYMT